MVAGRRDWSGPGWSIAIVDDTAALTTGSETVSIAPEGAGEVHVRRSWFRWGIYFGDRRLAVLSGLPRQDAASLGLALRRLKVDVELAVAVDWASEVDRKLVRAMGDQRWVSTETMRAFEANRPQQGLSDRVAAAECSETLDDDELRAISLVDCDLSALVVETNRRVMAAELMSRRQFFGSIEKSPLTDEQARAVVCFDNRVQVLAAAGSGKTSVMVARAAYAVERGFVAPERVLLLAFNKAAAAELQERIETRFKTAGIDSTGVRAATFHAFGLEVIGAATGRKPRLAAWLDHGRDIEEVLRIVDELSDASPGFRYDWDLYRLLFAGASTELDGGTPDGYDPATRDSGYRTFAGEIVKSHGERLIADFLYLSGVNYVYEQRYSVEVADSAHSQYHPDFYYPDVDVWHEHWGVDRDGNPPADFEGYAESMAWKRALHAEHGTTLIESTWADVVFGDGLSTLRAELESCGVVFDWNPDRRIADPWVRPIEHQDLARSVRTFMAHVKSNSMSPEAMEGRLAGDASKLDGFRTRLFLRIYWQIHEAWERRLEEDGSVDFEDMLLQAVFHLEAGNFDSPYELVMVDEFQDVSRARARLVRALVAKPGRFLLAVGDDWQSINRFAGADLSVMTGFASWFGSGEQLALTTTFRCPQTICDVARTFVSRNPGQFNKEMRSAHRDPGPPVTVIQSDDPAGAIAEHLDRLSADVAARRVKPGSSGRVTVDVLGRYNFNRDLLGAAPPNLDIQFRTVHGSKGLEADYIIVAGMGVGTYGFPSTIADDPVLALATPEAETFENAEERRLFYVALTRARRQVTLIAPTERMSPFVVELLDHPLVSVETASGTPAEPVAVCPECHDGTMVRRTGKYGSFLGCSTFPKCRKTQKLS